MITGRAVRLVKGSYMRNMFIALCTIALQGLAFAGPLVSVAVQSNTAAPAGGTSFEGVVEAVRQSTLSAQVPGAIIALNVKVGDSVRSGQELVRLDARSASQNSAAGQAQVEAAKAAETVAAKDYERQKQLFQKQYISQAALERAQAQMQATHAQVQAAQAQSNAAQTQTGFFSIRAPYSGIISEVPVALGDMAMPGRPLISMYDPAALRVSASVPQSALEVGTSLQSIQFDLPGQAAGPIKPASVTQLPQIDAATHSVLLRLTIPPQVSAVPGMFARVWLSPGMKGDRAGGRLYVPTSAVVRHTEMAGVYVIDAQGRAQLRQVRLGQVLGEQIEILSGVQAGERVASDPQAVARAH